MKVFHDDIRRPPDDSWHWARTNQEAMEMLEENDVEEISLDHDLGLHEVDPDSDIETIAWAGRSPDGSGYDLVCWMCDHERVPPKVRIHSWNPIGAQNMAARLNHFGYNCIIDPFKTS